MYINNDNHYIEYINNSLSKEHKYKHNNNIIKTTKYTFYNFLPKALFYQFLKVTNIYFFVLSILSLIKEISPFSPGTAIAPFLIILSFSLIKEMIDDLNRYVQNVKANKVKVTVVKDNQLIKVNSADLKIGDIVVITNNEFFPADLLLLFVDNNSDECYIQTSSLDGEKNLKVKYSLKPLEYIKKYYNNNLDLNFKLEISKPHFDFSNFNGNIYTKNSEKIIFSNKQYLPRGAKLVYRNNIYAMVVYVGKDTKLMLNMVTKDNKLSFVEKRMNKYILYILIFEVILMIFASIMNVIGDVNKYYVLRVFNPVVTFILNFFTYLLLLNTLIPISLVFTLEISRVVQIAFLYQDIYIAKNQDFKVLSSNLNEELGQVQYILSDKTGTLTSNKMTLNYINIGSYLYDIEQLNTDIKLNYLQVLDSIIFKRIGTKIPNSNINFEKINSNKISNSSSNNFLSFNFDNINLKYPIKILSDDKNDGIIIKSNDDLIFIYTMIILTCHDIHKMGDELNSQSPDEISLVEGLAKLNIKLISNDNYVIKVDYDGKLFELNKLGLIEFDNDRKCMSMVITIPYDSKNITFLFTKGADIRLFEISDPEFNLFNNFIKDTLEGFSQLGLRTLLMGFKILSNDETVKFKNDYDDYIVNKDIKHVVNYESKLKLIGSTAVEDKLIPGLSKTIKKIKQANIKLWILTGDKLETAVEIGYSSLILLKKKYTIIVKTEKELFNLYQKLEDLFAEKIIKKYSLVIQTVLLNKLLIENNNKTDDNKKFIFHLRKLRTCIFARSTPLQKSQIAQLIKNENKIVLCIGDGFNDVSMIQKASIGVGIFGNEGLQAVNNSDFGVQDFNKLDRLVLHHGRLYYMRIAKTILYFIYKNFLFTLNNYCIGFFAMFSGPNYYHETYIAFYNLLFTAFPLGVRVVFELDLLNYKHKGKYINENTSIFKCDPFLYYIGKNNKILNKNFFIISILQAIYETIIMFMITVYIFNDDHSLELNSTANFTLLIFVVNMNLLLNTKLWNIFTILFILITSLLTYFIYLLLVFKPVTFELFSKLTFYLYFFISLGLIFIIEYLKLVINTNFFKNNLDYINEYINKHDKVRAKDIQNIFNNHKPSIYHNLISKY